MTPIAAYVIDTSYLLELYAVPGKSSQEAISEIRRRFHSAGKRGSRLYVAVPSIYELAKHIIRVSDGEFRRELAMRMRDDLLSSLDGGMPWTLILSKQPEVLRELVSSFVDNHINEGIDLTDSTLIDEARRLKQERYRGPGWRVHIWTKDARLKAEEPDRERNAYLG